MTAQSPLIPPPPPQPRPPPGSEPGRCDSSPLNAQKRLPDGRGGSFLPLALSYMCLLPLALLLGPVSLALLSWALVEGSRATGGELVGSGAKKERWMENQLVGSTRGQRSADEMLLPTSRGLSGEKDLRKSFMFTK